MFSVVEIITVGQKLNFSILWLDVSISVGSTIDVIVGAADVVIVDIFDGIMAVVGINATESVDKGASAVELNSAEPKSKSSF